MEKKARKDPTQYHRISMGSAGIDTIANLAPPRVISQPGKSLNSNQESSQHEADRNSIDIRLITLFSSPNT